MYYLNSPTLYINCHKHVTNIFPVFHQDQPAVMGLHNDEYKTLEVMLTGSNNRTLKGVLNFTAMDLGGYSEEDEVYDGTGAATFVIVVILVYGLSIVLMIGSLAKKNMKVQVKPLPFVYVSGFKCCPFSSVVR